jgi:hypothetical protein
VQPFPDPAIAPTAAMPQTAAEKVPAANVGPPLDLAAPNARSLRAQRVSPHRKRDGRNIFDHLRQFGRAFADIAPAKRTDKAKPYQNLRQRRLAGTALIRPESRRR